MGENIFLRIEGKDLVFYQQISIHSEDNFLPYLQPLLLRHLQDGTMPRELCLVVPNLK